MLIFTKKSELQAHLLVLKSQKKSLGFVPTMGALHNGHLSLILASKEACDMTICSVFVNPTQFNDKNDLKNYPRMPEKDTEMLQKSGCDILFMPPVEEMYENDEKASFDFGYLDKILEGEHRPGHFNGVAQIVKRFFEIIQPDKAFFGSKDYQQVMIVKALVRQMESDIEVVACPIIREPDGLAMSSRNALLSENDRKVASFIPKLMKQAADIGKGNGIATAKRFVTTAVSEQALAKLDYFEICNADTLEPAERIEHGTSYIALIACFVGKIRLIDNLIL